MLSGLWYSTFPFLACKYMGRHILQTTTVLFFPEWAYSVTRIPKPAVILGIYHFKCCWFLWKHTVFFVRVCGLGLLNICGLLSWKSTAFLSLRQKLYWWSLLCFPSVVVGQVYVSTLVIHSDELSTLKKHSLRLRYLALTSTQVFKWW